MASVYTSILCRPLSTHFAPFLPSSTRRLPPFLPPSLHPSRPRISPNASLHLWSAHPPCLQLSPDMISLPQPRQATSGRSDASSSFSSQALPLGRPRLPTPECLPRFWLHTGIIPLSPPVSRCRPSSSYPHASPHSPSIVPPPRISSCIPSSTSTTRRRRSQTSLMTPRFYHPILLQPLPPGLTACLH